MVQGIESSWDPYQVLGLNRRASSQEIRKAYKQYAKEWHPDKNKNGNSEEKFVEINKAYELLNDPTRRKLYDQKGIIEDNINRSQPPNKFRFQLPINFLNSYFHLTSNAFCNLRGYENNILPLSSRQPYLVFVYSDWCQLCLRLLPIWQQLFEDLMPIGINLVTVHYDQEAELAYKLGAKRGELPHISFVIDSRISVFNSEDLTNAKIIEFIRNRFPRYLISSVDADNSEQFLNGWKDNKVRVVFVGKLQRVRLRYLTTAFKFKSYAKFGYIELNHVNTRTLTEELGVSSKLDSLLVFHEDPRRPAVRMSMTDLPYSTIKDVIEANKYLQLPRLTSQEVLDSLCPPESSSVRRRLCAILITDDLNEDEEAQQHLRKFSRQFKFSRDRMTFCYLFRKQQSEFLRTLTEGDETFPTKLRIVVVWRQDRRRTSFSWLAKPFVSGPDNWNSSIDYLSRSLINIVTNSETLPNETYIEELVDEFAQGFFERVSSRFLIASEVLKDNITKQELLAIGSVVGTVLFIVAIGYVMTYLVRIEEESIKRKNLGATKATTRNTNITELKLHELRSETYNGMVRLLKPGCRTVVLLLDNDSMDSLIPKFHKAVWPYRKNKSLLFGWMNVDRGLQWYGQLLNLAIKNIDEDDGLDVILDSNLVRSKNCVGTVIALNGHRRYFCIYHSRHPECLLENGRKRMQNMARRLTKSNNIESESSGAFMGFDSLTEDSDNSDVERGEHSVSAHDEEPLITEPLSSTNQSVSQLTLSGLSNWLDRLFEGSTQRYYINYWPEFGNH
uniref:DnaJ homolog subfamily C member 16 n=1 Tax=Scapholeberis mucronata TaxID=202097 RepID=A0A4Y7NJX6_9CRUS|nr:EOG090X049L [Scapholeberis mucronata]SVE93548.1 EOG090X049L [Scapholeberis mucronata]